MQLRYDLQLPPMADAGCAHSWHAGTMTIAIYAQLAVLALIDSTSIGTLLIPLWLLLRPDARRVAPRILLYLGVLAGFYLLIGIAVLGGAGWVLSGLGADSLTHLPAVQWGMVLAGGAMLAYSLFAGSGKKPVKVVAGAPGADVAEVTAAEQKWQSRLATALRSPGGIVTLALLAGLLELPTMLPYLAAIGLLANATLALPVEITILTLYCLLMLLPALALLVLRVALGARLDPLLLRISSKMGKFAGETLLWVVGIVGFLLLRAGLSAVAPLAPWNPFK